MILETQQPAYFALQFPWCFNESKNLDHTRIIVNFRVPLPHMRWVIFTYSFKLHMHDSGKHWRWNKNWTLPILSPLLFGLCTFPFRFHHHFAHLLTEIFTAALGTIFPLPLYHQSWFMHFSFFMLAWLASPIFYPCSRKFLTCFFFFFPFLERLSDFSVQKELVHSRKRINKGPRKHKRIAPIIHPSAAYNTSTYHLRNHDKPSNQIALAHNMLHVTCYFILPLHLVGHPTHITHHSINRSIHVYLLCDSIQSI